MIAQMMVRPATPPTTPPAMAPASAELELFVVELEEPNLAIIIRAC